MKLAIAVVAALGLLAAGIALAISVRREPEAPVVAPVAVRTPETPSSAAAPTVAARAPAIAPPTHTKFVAPDGLPARRFGGDGAKRFEIPGGGFARWTGREGTFPGELEAFADQAGLRMTVALEQRRSTVLAERTGDVEYLTELLGKPPGPEVVAAINRSASVLHEATATVQVHSRDGALSEEDALAQTRAAEDAYRQAYLAATGLTDARFERFFAPDRPFP